MADDPAIEATGLQKSYGSTSVLAGVDLQVPQGSVFSLLGPNGAGKTTTVRILSTLVRPDAGRARIAGLDVAIMPHLPLRPAAKQKRPQMSEITTPAPAAVSRGGGRATVRPLAALGDSLTMAARCVRLTRRELDALMMSLFLPVMLMVVFVYLFGGAISIGTRYVTYVVPGVLLLCAGVGSATTAVTVCRDMTGGIIDRFRSMDVGGLPFLAGHVAASLARNAASTALVLAVAFGIGFRPQAGLAAWAATVGVLLLYVLALTWLAAAAGLLVSSPEAANAFTFLPMFVTYASSAFVPVRTMPSWLRGFADYQPTAPVIETLRGLLLYTRVGGSGWQALAWCGGILVASVALSALAFRRRTS